MPWLVGIDEAGYGPNLGPLVMTSVACRLPDDLLDADLWQVLRQAVRRHSEPDDERLLVEDSKLVYSNGRGLIDLEKGALAALPGWHLDQPTDLRQYSQWVCPAANDELGKEPWYTGASLMPVVAERLHCEAAAQRLGQVCAESALHWGLVRSVVICPTRFNALLDRWGSKGAVLGHALGELLSCNRELADPNEPVFFVIDKHGGRNHYAAVVQNALTDGLVVAHEEGSQRSDYSVLGLPRFMRLRFQPRADAEHFCVALASMFSKYLREMLMREFNHFWQNQVPGLKATAGYPGDAARFWKEIRLACRRLGIAKTTQWRRK
jgi:hypothetical protein